MPSPVGHALAGLTTAWTLAPRCSRRLLTVATGLAVLPDADLVHQGWHRSVTHSIGAALAVTIIAAAVTGWVNRSSAEKVKAAGAIWWTPALVCGAAYASHLLLDWLAADHFAPYGIRALWPFDDGWYISGLELFRQTARREILSSTSVVQNAKAIAQELLILAPVVYVVWLVRVKPATRLAPELTRVHHSAQ